MDQKVELKKVFGDVYFTAERVEGNAYINAQWYGVQSVETVKAGGYKLIDIMQQKSCPKLLNSNKNVIGSWDMALDWAQREWAPLMRKAGLRYLAQVVPASFYATLTIENLIQKIDSEFEIRTFDNDADAIKWLLSVDVVESTIF